MTQEEFDAEKARQLAALKEWEAARMSGAVCIPGWPGYAVTEFGEILSLTRYVKGKRDFRIHKPRILKPFGTGIRLKYLMVRLCHNGKQRSARVHQLVAAAFIGPCPAGHEVDHIDSNTKNNSATNLRYLPVSINRSRRNGW